MASENGAFPSLGRFLSFFVRQDSLIVQLLKVSWALAGAFFEQLESGLKCFHIIFDGLQNRCGSVIIIMNECNLQSFSVFFSLSQSCQGDCERLRTEKDCETENIGD